MFQRHIAAAILTQPEYIDRTTQSTAVVATPQTVLHQTSGCFISYELLFLSFLFCFKGISTFACNI